MHEFRYSEMETDQPTLAILEAVSSAKDTEPENLSPIADKIAPDALNDLYSPTDPGDFTRKPDYEDPEYPRTTFEYEGFLVNLEPGRFTLEET